MIKETKKDCRKFFNSYIGVVDDKWIEAKLTGCCGDSEESICNMGCIGAALAEAEEIKIQAENALRPPTP